MKKITLNILMFLLLFSIGAKGTNYTWNGATSTAWNTTTNWTPNGTPGSGDYIIITASGTYHPVLTITKTVSGMTLSGGTIDLGGDTLILNSGTSSFSGGAMSNGLLTLRGTDMTFSGTSFSVPIDAIVNRMNFNGGTFNNYCYFESVNSVPGTGTGDCTFNDSAYFYHNYTGGGVWTLGTTNPNRFNGKVTFRNKSTSQISTGAAFSLFGGDIVIENSNTGGIYLVNDTLTSGHTLSIGSNGFTDGELRAPGFYQAGSSDAINLTFTGTALPTLDGTTFNGTVNITSNTLLFKNCTFNGAATITATGSGSSSWYGGNKFYGNVTVTNNASGGNLRLDTDTANTYFANATFNGSRELRVTYGAAISSFYGNITTASNTSFNAGSGTLCLAGSSTQLLDFNSSTIVKNLKLNKSGGSASLVASLTVSGLTTFTKGNLTTTSSNLLTMTSASSVSGASDTSFIDGPVKKVGNSAFVFPIGKESNYRPLEISAPSSSSAVFSAEFFNDSSSNASGNRQSGITYLMPYTHWNLTQITGSSSVYVHLYWNQYSVIDTPALSNVARWNGSQWSDLGNGAYTTGQLGKVRTSSTTNSFGDFVLSYNSSIPFAPCPGSNHNNPNCYYKFDNPTSPESPSAPGISNTVLTGLSATSNYNASSGVDNTGAAVIGNTSGIIKGFDLALDNVLPQRQYFAVEMAFRLNGESAKQRGTTFFYIGLNGPITGSIDKNKLSFVTNDIPPASNRDEFAIELNGIGPKSFQYYIDGNWHHIAFVYNASRKEVWIDGVLYPDFIDNSADALLSTDYIFHLARTNVDNFTGDIDQVAIYSYNQLCNDQIIEHALNVSEQNDYNYGVPTVPPFTASTLTLTSQFDENEYPLGYAPGSGDYREVKTAIKQLEAFPLPRYDVNITLRRNFNWMGSNYFGGYTPSAGAETATDASNALDIQKELYSNWYYLFNVCENTGTYFNSLSNQKFADYAASGGSAFEKGMITNRKQLVYNDALLHFSTYPGTTITYPSTADLSCWISNKKIHEEPSPDEPALNWYLVNGSGDTYDPQTGAIDNALEKRWIYGAGPVSGSSQWSDPYDLYENDGRLQDILLNAINTDKPGCFNNLKVISENNETTIKSVFDFVYPTTSNPKFIQNLYDDFATWTSNNPPNATPSNISWEKYHGDKKQNLDLDYSNVFMNNSAYSGSWGTFGADGVIFLNYAVDAQDVMQQNNGSYIQLPRYWYANLRETQTEIDYPNHLDVHLATPDFYPRRPSDWLRESNSADHGFKWLTRSKYKELASGDHLNAPFVSPGWSSTEEENIRPGQWLGLLKATAMLGVDFFHVFNEPSKSNSRGYAWQAAIPSYAHATASRFQEFLDSGDLLSGDLPQQAESSYSHTLYAFNGGSPDILIVARKKTFPIPAEKYVLTGSVQPVSNSKDNAPLEKEAKISLTDGVSTYPLQFNVRRQGSTYVYDRTGLTPVFYQLDKWHEYKHPDRWSKDFYFEGEVYDNTTPPSNVDIATEVPPGTAAGDYRNFTSYLTFSGNPTMEYNFHPRVDNTDYFVWLKLRQNGATAASLEVKLYDVANTTTTPICTLQCVSNSGWNWYRFLPGSLSPILLSQLDNSDYVLQLTPVAGNMEIDQVVIAEDQNLSLEPQPDMCGTLSSTLCVSNVYTVSTANGNTTASDIITNGGLTYDVVHIVNDLTINADFNFTGKGVLCDPGVKIIVQANNTLTIEDQSHFYGCVDLWKGIVLENHASELVIENSIIEDAEAAIEITNNPSTVDNITLTNSIFDHNFISLLCKSTNAVNYANLTIDGCSFRSKGRDIYDPYLSPFVHIYLYSPYNLEIGNSNLRQNKFEDAGYMNIFLTDPGKYLIENNYIANWKVPDVPPNTGGYGIYTLSNQMPSAAPNADRIISKNIFEGLRYGVDVHGYQAMVQNNTLSNIAVTGVLFEACTGNNASGYELKCTDNSLGTSLNNIVFDRCISNKIIISGNSMGVKYPDDANYYTSGIAINTAGGSNPIVTIDNNTINSTGTYGIYVNNEQTGSNTLSLENNIVEMNNVFDYGQKLCGIKLNSCSAPYVGCNYVVGNSYSSLPNKTCIQFEICSSTFTKCNTIDLTENGMVFTGNCNNSIIAGNTFNEHYRGLVAGNTIVNGIVGDQTGFNNGTAYTPGNKYQGKRVNGISQNTFGNIGIYGTGYHTFRYNTTTANTINLEDNDLTDANNPKYYLYPLDLTAFFGLGCSPFLTNPLNNSGNVFDCSSSPCAGSSLTNNTQLNEMVLLAQDSLPTNEANRLTITSAKYDLFKFLQENLNWLDSSVVLQNFYDSASVENIGKLYVSNAYSKIIVEDAIFFDEHSRESAVSDAETADGDLDESDLYIANKKAFNSVYYNWITAQVDTLTPSDSTMLADIANQCPYVGGSAVYEARALIEKVSGRVYYNEEILCADYISAPRKAGDIKDSDKIVSKNIIVYPNPTANTISIETPEAYDKAILQVIDLMGKIVLEQNLSSKERITKISLEFFPPGTYFYNVKNVICDGTKGKITLIK